MKYKSIFFSLLITTAFNLNAQVKDTLLTQEAPEVQIRAERPRMQLEMMEHVHGMTLTAGKKNEIITMANSGADLSSNNTRQIFGRVPGVSVWESEGSGIQVSIATRGLSPNRSWEFNTRQDGYDISPDVFGYPESYYTPPMEALEKIELIRGGSSLQYGPQFGGMLNYIIKNGQGKRKIFYEGRQTAGSYGLFSSYNAIGGTVGKISYYTYFQNRTGEGWRENSAFSSQTGYAGLTWTVNKKLDIGLAYTRMTYESQQPGGLTDKEFEEDARQSNRSRNWFSAPWNVAALTANLKLNENTKLSAKIFGIMANRSSIGYVRAVNIPDTFNVALNSYNPRQLDRDFYTNAGAEFRILHSYKLFNEISNFAAGARLYHCETDRRQLGKGTTGNDFSVELTDPRYGRSLEFGTTNYAVFAENIFKLTSKLTVTPGIRFESIRNTSSGYINTTDDGALKSESRERNVLLAGVGMEYALTTTTNWYANITQGFRPVTYSDLTPSATTDVIDQNLKDATGYNADFGYRGRLGSWFNFDVGLFYLYYNNRIGTLVVGGTNYRTNIGASTSKGLEAFAEMDFFKALKLRKEAGSLSLFVSSALVDARYTRWDNPAIAQDATKAIEGKRVEYAPRYTHRFGLTYRNSGFSLEARFNRIGKVYTDAANTEKASANAQSGVVKGYEVMDISVGYKLNENFSLLAGVNNVADARYATRRAGGYPGPGLLPSNGRTFFMTLGVNF